jgi:hypothetical protein
MGVLNSGATHAVCPKKKCEKCIERIKVDFVGRKEVMMEMHQFGTLLGSEDTSHRSNHEVGGSSQLQGCSK